MGISKGITNGTTQKETGMVHRRKIDDEDHGIGKYNKLAIVNQSRHKCLENTPTEYITRH